LHYLKLSFWPNPLILDYKWPIAQSFLEIFLPGLIIIGLLFLTIWALKRKPKFGFLGVWFFLILLPTSSFIPIADLAFEHRVYLSLAGLIALVVFLGDIIISKWPAPPKMKKMGGIIIVGIICVLLGGRTIIRNYDYRTRRNMWEEVLSYRPNNSRALYNLGLTYLEKRQLDEALDHFLKALAIKSDYVMAHNNIGNIYYEKGEAEKAKQYFEQAIQLDESYSEVHNNYGVMLMENEEYAKARQHLLKAIELSPLMVEYIKNLGNLHYLTLDLNKAVSYYKKVLLLKPDHVSARNSLAHIYYDQGKLVMAKNEFLRALSYHPDDPFMHTSLGTVYMKLGDYRSAEFHLNHALRLDPHNEEARNNLSVLFGQKNKMLKNKGFSL